MRKTTDLRYPKRWAVCLKGYWKVFAVYFSKEKAEKCIEGHEDIMEVREVIG